MEGKCKIDRYISLNITFGAHTNINNIPQINSGASYPTPLPHNLVFKLSIKVREKVVKSKTVDIYYIC